MAQFYFDPSRENDPHALPDGEVFYASHYDCADCGYFTFVPSPQCPECGSKYKRTLPDGAGWFYWACFPGCLPDGDPIGPFETEEEALADAREVYDV